MWCVCMFGFLCLCVCFGVCGRCVCRGCVWIVWIVCLCVYVCVVYVICVWCVCVRGRCVCCVCVRVVSVCGVVFVFGVCVYVS